MKKITRGEVAYAPVITVANAKARGVTGEMMRDGSMLPGEAAGAIPNGARVRKVLFEKGDTHPIGSLATVLSSLGPMPFWGAMIYGYFVEWDALPGVPVFVVGTKIATEAP